MKRPEPVYTWRFYAVLFVLFLLFALLVWRMLDLGVIHQSFYLKQSQARTLRSVEIPAYRGMITDRFGQPLAVSTPVDAVWINPKIFQATDEQITELSRRLKIKKSVIVKKASLKNRGFLYLKRHVPPQIAQDIKAMKLVGVFFQREYQRFYPAGNVAAHVVGFTNIDDKGQEGLELAYDQWLRGVPGVRKVVKDRLGYVVADIDTVRPAKQGHDLQLSIDSRIQYLAFHALADGVKHFRAKAGSVVVLDVKTGEILAMTNVPSYNPNHRPSRHDGRYRNRAVTDIFEPGSTLKTFGVMSALLSGKYTPDSKIDTRPGWMAIDRNVIKDDSYNGIISVTNVLKKSSNVGVAKMNLSLPPENVSHLLEKLGFGERTQSGFPGEAAGHFVDHQIWRPIHVASLSFGYGVSVTALQLAHAYAILAADGVKYPVSFLKLEKTPEGERVLPHKIVNEMMMMLQSVLEKGGTGKRARVPGYKVAGKTGTAYIAGRHGYHWKRRYTASFVGIAPVTDPRLVVAVVVREPANEAHFGGLVAAPIFSKIMTGALRLTGAKPDDIS